MLTQDEKQRVCRKRMSDRHGVFFSKCKNLRTTGRKGVFCCIDLFNTGAGTDRDEHSLSSLDDPLFPIYLGGGNSKIFVFTPTWGRFPFWLIFFKQVETTN